MYKIQNGQKVPIQPPQNDTPSPDDNMMPQRRDTSTSMISGSVIIAVAAIIVIGVVGYFYVYKGRLFSGKRSKIHHSSSSGSASDATRDY